MIGRTLSHYQIVEKLGEGGMGVVYRALDTRLNRPVALKVLPSNAAGHAARVRFAQEAKTASSLNHPNIITVHDVDAADGVEFIAMEYVTGRTLDQVIGRKGMGVKDALKIAVQVADALAAAHAAGIVHRDLKPANVMVTDKGLVKVLDFGLAKLTERWGLENAAAPTILGHEAPRTEEGTILGTVAYMSPEQAEGKPVDARSDIFSFGSLLYELVTGRRVFQRETKLATLSAILQNEPTPAGTIAEGVPLELDQIIAHCLRKEPDRRFQHLDDVKTLLDELQHRSATSTIAAPTTDHDGGARRRGAALLAGTLACLVAVWAAWSLTSGRSSSTQAPNPAGATGTRENRPRVSTGGPASPNVEANRYFENAMQTSNVNDIPRAQQMLERALALDPRFAEARAWSGFSNWLLLDQGYSNDSALLYKAEAELRGALQDAPGLARAHTSFAMVYLMQGRKELVLAEVEKAEKANPGDADASQALMNYHVFNGDYETARRVGQTVLDRLPLFFPNRMLIGEILRQQGDLPGAIEEQSKILEQDPANIYALCFLARAYVDAGDSTRAREALDRARPPDRRLFRTRRTRAILLAVDGRRAEAVKEMDSEVLKWSALVAYETAEVADFYAVIGDAAKALEWLDAAVRNGDERADWFRRNPLLANIREDPRFQQITDSISNRRLQRKTSR